MNDERPQWLWDAARPLQYANEDSKIREVLPLLQNGKSSEQQNYAELLNLKAKFLGWLHQDEFGPSRGRQTAALRVLKKSCERVQKHLGKGYETSRFRLNELLQTSIDPKSSIAEALYQAALDLADEHRRSAASGRKIAWAAELAARAEMLMMHLNILDDNTDGAIFLSAVECKFDVGQKAGPEIDLESVERWIAGYWGILNETLATLTAKRGPDQRISLRLLVELLCQMWERETGHLVTAHGVNKDVYTARPQTRAGRFVLAAVEAMIPDRAWFEEHGDGPRLTRAQTFDSKLKASRATTVLGMMRNYVSQRDQAAVPKVA